MSLLTRKEHSLWGLIVFAFPQESPCISFAGFVLTINYSSINYKSHQQLTASPVRVAKGGDSCRNSTCPKTPQYFKEGRLKPFFANNVDIPFARARRLRPCPRKASAQSDPGRQE